MDDTGEAELTSSSILTLAQLLLHLVSGAEAACLSLGLGALFPPIQLLSDVVLSCFRSLGPMCPLHSVLLPHLCTLRA